METYMTSQLIYSLFFRMGAPLAADKINYSFFVVVNFVI